MARLTKQQISDTLHLDDAMALGNMLESLISGYQNPEYHVFDYPYQIPLFLDPSFGPPLERLPSFASMTQRREHHEMIAHADHGIKGIGEVMEVLHGEMRRVAGRAGMLFAPSTMGIIAHSDTAGNHFDPAKAEALRKFDSATITLKTGEPPLEIHYPGIRYYAFMIGASARSFLSRSGEEKETLKRNVGSLKNSLISTNHLIGIIRQAMDQDPYYRDKKLEDYGLAYDTDKIATAFHMRQKELSAMYDFLYIVTATAGGGKLDPHIQDLKWAIDPRERPASGLRIDTAEEAASVMFAISARVGEPKPDIRILCDRIAMTTNTKDAAIIMQQADVLTKLRERIAIRSRFPDDASPPPSTSSACPFHQKPLPEFIASSSQPGAKPDGSYDASIPYAFLLEMVDRLQQFQDQQLEQGPRTSQDHQARSGHSH